MRIILLFLFYCIPLSSLAQDSRSGVYISGSTEDGVGSRLAYEIREQIRASHGLKISDTRSESIIRLKISTMDPDYGFEKRTVYSFVITVRSLGDGTFDTFWAVFLGTCGEDVVKSCASTLVARTDSVASEIRGAIKKHVAE